MTGALLTLNAGSSSIKFAVYEADASLKRLAHGQIENLTPGLQARLSATWPDASTSGHDITADTHEDALANVLDATDRLTAGRPLAGVGHRIVHGGPDHAAPAVLDAPTIEDLYRLSPLAPLHQPHNLSAVRAAMAAFPDARQVACFDTAFHRNHPWVNDTFALPRKWYGEGVRRYGFHGLSYDYVTGELARLEPDLAAGRVIIAHLGNGASMCAVRGGRSIGSTMGFSPLDGLPMGTRCGQIDPGVLLYMMQAHAMTADAISDLLYRQSGLKGLSGMTSDMRTLETSDAPEAREAIDYFVFRIRRELGAMAAVLGGVDAVVFCGGIGENSALVRARVCETMQWLGIGVDAVANAGNARDFGTGSVRLMVIPTDEEIVIARAVQAEISA